MPILRAMWMICAILAVITWTPEPTVASDVLDEPRLVEFRLADGVRIRGKATLWNTSHFDGSFGKRFWFELNPDDAWRVIRRLVNDDTAADWIQAGEILLTLSGQSEKAEYAFRRALEVDPDVAAAIEEARQNAAEAEERIAKEQAEREKVRLAATTPEARDWTNAPWPQITAIEWRNAREQMLVDAEQVVSDLQVDVEVLESTHYFMYTDLDRSEAAKWLVRLDRHCKQLIEMFDLPQNAPVYWGKPVVFVWKERDRFRLVEASSFNQLVEPDSIAVTHFRGPQVFINAWRRMDDALLESALAHESVHAFMHSYLSPHRLPAWANEGLAELFAQRVLDDSYVHQGMRPLGLQLIREGFPVMKVLEMRYSDGSFPGERNAGYAIGQIVIEHMMREAGRGDAFLEWVKSVKMGVDWKKALATHFNGTPEGLAQSVTAFYRVND